MLQILICLTSIGVICYFYFRIYKYWEKKGVSQNKYPIPPFGDNFDNMFKGYSFFDLVFSIYNRFPSERYTGLYQFNLPVLMMRDPELIKNICVKNFEHFLDHRPFLSEANDPLWNKNLFSLRGQKWKDMRATLSPSFTGSKMRQMFALMHDCSVNFVKYFAEDSEDIIEVELKDTFTRYTNDIIATTAFGIQCDSLRVRDNEFYVRGKQTTDLTGFWKNMKFILVVVMPWTGRFFDGIIFDTEVSIFFRRIIRETLEFREKNKIERPDMIHLLMQARKGVQKDDDHIKNEEHNFAAVEEHLEAKYSHRGKIELSLDDITSQALIFFFAGFDTVSSAMCFMAYELATNPDVQMRLLKELDEFRATKEKLTYESLAKLTYLDMVFCETMRKWPPTVAVDRLCVKPFTIQPENPGEKPVHLEVGDTLWVPIWALHHDPKYWENPDKFDPERFSPENKSKITPYTYLPFGVGPRNCIGSRFAITEVKTVVYGLLEHFEIVPTAKSDIPFVPNKRSFNLTAKNGFWFGLKKRNSGTARN